jgi:hypothetical protein
VVCVMFAPLDSIDHVLGIDDLKEAATSYRRTSIV